jgi:Sigma-70, region 4
MVEVLGLARSDRAKRKALIWRGGKRDSGKRNGALWDALPYRRLCELLQYFRGSLIGTPELARETQLSDRHALLGALKALLVLGHVEAEHLDPQTIAWRWISGNGASRTYTGGYFHAREAPVALDDGPRRQEDGRVRWTWLDDLVHREWLLQDSTDGFAAVADNDGLRRYRPPSLDGELAFRVITEQIRTMPRLQRAATALTLVHGLTEADAAAMLGCSRATVRRHAAHGLIALRQALTRSGYSPSTMTQESSVQLESPDDVADAA